MRKFKITNLLSLLLIIVLLSNLFLVSCKDKQTESTNEIKTPDKIGNGLEIDNVSDFHVEGTVHEYNITDTDSFILQNGVTEYSLVISRNALLGIFFTFLQFCIIASQYAITANGAVRAYLLVTTNVILS